MEKLKIYNNDGTPFNNLYMESYTCSDTALEFESTIEGSFISPIPLLNVFKWNEYVIFEGQKYILFNDIPQTRQGDSDATLYKYAAKFYAPKIELTKMQLVDTLQSLRTFSFFSSEQRLFELIEANLPLGWSIVVQSGLTLSEQLLDEPITFDKAYVSEAIQHFHSSHSIPYNIQGTTIYIGEPSTIVGHTFEFGHGLGMKNDNSTPKNNDIATRVFATGSTENIPYPYPKFYDNKGELVRLYKHKSIKGEITYRQIFQTALMPSIYRKTLEAHIANDFDAENYPVIEYYDAISDEKYTYHNEIDPNFPLPLDVDDTNIRPSIEGMTWAGYNIDEIKSVSFLEDDNDNVNFETGEVEKPTFFIELYPLGFDLYAQAAVTGAMTFAMRSGDTIGAEYKVQVDQSEFEQNFYTTTDTIEEGIEVLGRRIGDLQVYIDREASLIGTWESRISELSPDYPMYEELVRELEGMKMAYGAYTGNQAALRAKMQSLIDDVNNFVSEIIFDPNKPNRDYTKFPDSTNKSITIEVTKDIETFDWLLPNTAQKPKSGDKFVILHIEMPIEYVVAKEMELETFAIESLKENNERKRTYPITLDEGFLCRNPSIANQISTNSSIRYKVGDTIFVKPVQSITRKFFDEAIVTWDITITDEITTTTNSIQKNTVAIKEQGSVIQQQSTINEQQARWNNYASQKALNGLFDAEGGNRIDNVEANVIYTNGLLVGQNANDFAISGSATVITDNTIQLTSGTLKHFWTEAPFENKEWFIANSPIITLDNTVERYYVYIQANRANNSAIWLIDTEQKKYNQDENVWYFNSGQLIYTESGWAYQMSNGLTSTLGGYTSTHQTKSPNFQLTESVFTGMLIDFLNAKIYMGDGAQIITRSISIASPDGEVTTQPNDRGAWSAGTYYANDRVSHNGSLWRVKANVASTTEEPRASASDWAEDVAKGEKGDTGEIENLAIGGVNLLDGSSEDWIYRGGETWRDSNLYIVKDDKFYFTVEELGVKAGDVLTFSVDVQNASRSYKLRALPRVNGSLVQSGFESQYFTGGRNSFTLPALPEGTTQLLISLFMINSYQSAEIRHAQIEVGTVPSAWKLSPADVNNQRATEMGYASYEELKNKAIEGETVIKGGYINAELIEAHAITAEMIDVQNLEVSKLRTEGDTVVIESDGSITARAGTFTNVDIEGVLRGSTSFTGLVTNANLFYLPATYTPKILTLSTGATQIGKTIKIYNANTSLPWTIRLAAFSYTVSDIGNSTYVESYIAYGLLPLTTIEVTCFERPPIKEGYDYGGEWIVTNRYSSNRAGMPLMAAYFGRILRSGSIAYEAHTLGLANPFIVKREGIGRYSFTAQASISVSNMVVVAQGVSFDGSSMLKCTTSGGINESSKKFYVFTSDDASANDGEFEIIIYSNKY